jgi:hypothetical protein
MGEAGGGEVKAKKARNEEEQVADPQKSEWAAALGSKRYFLSLFWKRFRRGFSLERRRQAPRRTAFHPSAMRNAQLPLPRGSESFVG